MAHKVKTSCWIQSSILSAKSGDRECSLSEEKIIDIAQKVNFEGIIRRVGHQKGDISPHLTMQYLGRFTPEERDELFNIANVIWSGMKHPLLSDRHGMERMGTFVGSECFTALNFEISDYQKIIRLRKDLHYETGRLGIEIADPTTRQWNPHVSLLQFENLETMDRFYQVAFCHSDFDQLHSMPILFAPPAFAFYDEEKNLHVKEFVSPRSYFGSGSS